jgi:hypothetical protein
MSVISATWEVEKNHKLHASLGKVSETIPKNNNNQKQTKGL